MKSSIKRKLYAFKSKTIRFATAIGSGVFLLPDAFQSLKDELPFLQGVIAEDIYKYLAIVAVVGTVYYRVKTSTPLAAYKSQNDGETEQGGGK